MNSIVSGVFQGAILIHEVYPDGAAAKDKRLKPGDQILDVNGEGFRSVTHNRALTVLRQTPAKVNLPPTSALWPSSSVPELD